MGENQLSPSMLKTMLDEMASNLEESITKRVTERIDNLQDSLISDLNEMKIQTEDHSNRLDFIERELKKRNIVIFGIEENENNYFQLEETVLDIINNVLKVNCDPTELDFVRRIGKKIQIFVQFLFDSLRSEKRF